MSLVPNSFSVWSFLVGLAFAYFILPMLLNLIGNRKKAAAA